MYRYSELLMVSITPPPCGVSSVDVRPSVYDGFRVPAHSILEFVFGRISRHYCYRWYLQRFIHAKNQETVNATITAGIMESNSDNTPPPPAAAAASVTSASADDATIAQCLQAVDSLTSIFGFPYDVANHAVNEVGPDVTVCYNFILDQQLAKDGGGAIEPIDSCPHIQQHVQVAAADISEFFQNSSLAMLEIPCCIPPNHRPTKPTGGLKSEEIVDDDTKAIEEEHCPLGENWFCLATKKILCSRYVNGHALRHYNDTGHCIAVSLADLSVWCHACEAYIKDNPTTNTSSTSSSSLVLKPILQSLEAIKFGGENEASTTKKA